ncbi:MAG TPA: protein translocase subunit SecD, partial [Candidatus Limnocylindria bacterium]|nr:protein translocase subunit SecD [Candidatus Limnocylindria bacterium]
MRRYLPLLIVAIGLASLAINFLPLQRPFADSPALIDTRLGLDLQGGLRGEYQAIGTAETPVTPERLEVVRTIIENRINQYGVAEPIVQAQGADRVVVELPGVENPEEVRRLIGSTGLLEFVPIPRTMTGITQGVPRPAELPALFTGEEIDVARIGFDQTGRRAVDFELRAEGARLFADYTRRSIGDQFAIVLDGTVVSAPVIQGAITGGRGQISGSFTTAEINNLVTVLTYGALPHEIDEVSFSRISPTLGLNFLQQSVLAGGIGIALVFIFMLVHYRLPGVVACIALVYYAIVIYAIFRFIPVTLTLAGVAAFVLSVGMAVDANILIFERTKEELRSGKTLVSAIEAGFNRAWNSIFDSNVSSVITAGILFYFGSSVIRGFALVLIIGVLLSMFTAITLSRELLRWVVRQPWARRAGFYGVAEDEFIVATPRSRAREARALCAQLEVDRPPAGLVEADAGDV